MRFLVLLSVAVCQLLAAVPAAVAATPDEIAGALASDPVYVDPAADPTITSSEAARLRSAIDGSIAGPVFVAVIGGDALDAAGGDPQLLVDRIADEVGVSGAYAVVADGRFRTAARGSRSPASVAGAADQAFAEGRRDGVARVLEAFVQRLDADGAGAGLPAGPADGSAVAARVAGDDTGLAFVGLGGLLVPLLMIGGAFFVVRRLVRRRASVAFDDPDPFVVPTSEGSPFAGDVRALAEQDVLDLGSDIYDLDPVVHATDAPRPALEEFRRAVGHYDRAQELLRVAVEPDDLAPVTEAIEHGRYAIAATRARLAGEELPERRAPCFFDPRHGPSTTDVEWAPPGGALRLVPACAMDADRVGRGAAPAARELLIEGERMPYWDAPARYRGWAGGWFGGFGGPALLGGLLLGGLGGMFTTELLSGEDDVDEGTWDDDADAVDGASAGAGDF
jgi:hypothetical protein